LGHLGRLAFNQIEFASTGSSVKFYKGKLMFDLSVLVSGVGSTLDNLAFHCFDENEGMTYGFLSIKRVVSDRDCKAIEVAEKWKLPWKIVRKKDFPDVESWSEAILDGEYHLHIMGGFLSRIKVPERLKNRILNIHPSLLPAYGGQGMYGIKVHEAVIANEENFSGCTVHVVDDELDHGPIIAQIKQGVLLSDDARSLQYAIQNMEKLLYPRAILNYCRQKSYIV
jgi:phosphoribosylglycinamide formyltransferase 1